MIVSIHQPHYMPWGGYFNKIYNSDVFVLLDTVQFEKNGWQNRNKIKTNQGEQWLTVPVKHKLGQKIYDVEISGSKWIKKHIKTIEQNYKCRDNDNWKTIRSILEKNYNKLSDLNCELVSKICNILGITTSLLKASELGVDGNNADDRIINIVRKIGGTVYLAGIGGKNYMDLKKYPFTVQLQHHYEGESISIIDKFL